MKFELNFEGDTYDDSDEFKILSRATDIYCAMSEFDSWLMRAKKRGEDESISFDKLWEEWWQATEYVRDIIG